MTTLYRPEIIKTVARADALPGGTFIRLSIMSDSWTRLLAPEDRDPHEANDVPFPALVPIEAEEEFGAGGDGMDEDFYLTRRLVTPWEEA